MAAIVRLPITNLRMGGPYTGTLRVGGAGAPLDVILDTGSSTLAVDGAYFDPGSAPATRTTNLAQTIQYGAGSWVGAVVETAIGFAPEVTVAATTLAVTYAETERVFGGAHGILGLAYAPLDAAYTMAADTWATRYAPAQIQAAPLVDLAPYFTQLEATGVVANVFAFTVRRAVTRVATATPDADPANHGLLILGGGTEATDLYRGEFTSIAVVGDVWYDTNLLAVQVGDRPPIAVPAVAPTQVSNSIVDSGTNVLLFPQAIYQEIVAALAAIDPSYADAVTTHAAGTRAGFDQAQLASWPPLRLTFQGTDGAPATIEIAATHYWQLDAVAPGLAQAYLCGDGGAAPGRAILGLPLFCGYHVVFDRSAGAGRGVIRFAAQA